MPNELITFQFGNYSNYIGAHYWNIQQNQLFEGNELNEPKNYDLNSQILFRDSLNIQNKETLTPRVILFESKDNVSIQRHRDVRHHSHHSRSKSEKPMENIDLNWKGEIEVYEKEQKEIEEYTVHEIEQGVHKEHMKTSAQQEGYWTDFMKFKYNEHSYSYIDSQLEPFDLFNYGVNAFKDANFSDYFENKVRYFAEECGQIQGFQMFANSFDGFGGLTSKYVSYLSEEFSKRPIIAYLSFPYFDEQAVEMNTFRLINTALTLKNILQDNQHTLVTPLSMFNSFYLSKELKPVDLESVNYVPSSSYQTSGILASLIDCSSTPWIQKNKFTMMSDIIDLFDVYNYKLAAMQAIFPVKIEKEKYLYNYLEETDLILSSKWFSPFCSESSLNTTEKTSQVAGTFDVCCKGLIDERVKNPRDMFVFSSVVPAHVVLERYFSDMYPKSKSACFSSKVPLNTASPYPNIFQRDELSIPEGSNDENNISLMTILQANKSIWNWIKFIETHVEEISFVKYTRYFENGMEQDDFSELINFIHDISANFSI